MSSTVVSESDRRGRSTGYLGRRARGRISASIAYILLALGGLVMLLPFVWLVSSSLKDSADIFVLPPQWIPSPVQWSNYSDVMTILPFWSYLRNTLVITFTALLGQVLTSSMGAYAFARLRWWGKDKIFAVILATMMVPYAVTLIPAFILFKELHWLDTFLPLIVPYWLGGGPYNIFLLRQFFRTIPIDLDESARIDGATSWTIFSRIIIPLSKPALAVVTVFAFLFHWNDFFGPLVYLTSDANRTLALGLVALENIQGGRDLTNLIMAVSVIMIAPIIVLFFFAQRTFIEGIVLTGIKA